MPAPLAALPDDEVQLERTLADRLVQLLLTVPGVGKVWATPRFPEDDEEDIAITTVPDPQVGDDDPYTNVIEVGLPTVSEKPYTGDTQSALDFTYPIKFDLGVVDSWEGVVLPYPSSSHMAIGIYMRARRKFKQNRTLGFKLVEHDFLQQVGADVILNDKGEALWHSLQWSITIKVTGCKV